MRQHDGSVYPPDKYSGALCTPRKTPLFSAVKKITSS